MIKPRPDVTISVFTIRSHRLTMGNASPASVSNPTTPIRQSSPRAAYRHGHESGSVCRQVRIR